MDALGLFSFMGMFGNYEQRKVDRYESPGIDGLMVDTCAVTDSTWSYETAVMHPAYNDGKWVIVEGYETKEKAQTGHKRWVKKMTSKRLPKTLRDVSTAEITKLRSAIGGDDWRENPATIR